MRIFVGNLAREASEEELRALFEPLGEVTKLDIMKDRYTGDPRGFAFVEMSSEAQAKAAIEKLDKFDFKGRKLTVNEAKPREQGGGGGGGGGERGGRGGYGGGGGGGGYGGGGGRGGRG